MARLVGRIVWDATAAFRWLAGLADVLPAVHAAEVGGEAIGYYTNYDQRPYEPPGWAERPAVWARAF